MSSTPTASSGPHLPLQSLPQQQSSWTDDLPVCNNSGVGYETNKAYRRDGYRTQEHTQEDYSFHFELDTDLCLYGVFDGHDGSRAAHFAQQRMPAELSFGQLTRRGSSDESVCVALQQAFLAVEKGFFEMIDEALAQRAMLLSEIPAGLTEFEANRDHPAAMQKLTQLNSRISGGTTAVVVVVHQNRLYVSNVGDSRALLCKTDENGILKVLQLTTDHTLTNEDELLRLQQLGMDVTPLRQGETLAGQEVTRCLGNYRVKGGYREDERLRACCAEPALAEPDFVSVQLDESCRFLLLLSRGLYRALEEVRDEPQVNKEVAQLVVEEFAKSTTLAGVAQTVVNRVARDHQDCFINSGNKRCQRCEDMTLLVRNFSYPLRSSGGASTVTSNTFVTTGHPSTTSSSTNSSEQNTNPYSLSLDADQRIKPYISFDGYRENLQKAKERGEFTDETWWKRLLNM
ncbi:TGF-beta-activated kinase 1 and MAP3K7-binding protein 1-like [Pollicipes pollicipes]|uniref:TGF-beta-activated kinase 1 and MAP3K7-binding protein 1-like n=1 Tax=Pollicipes pollicipes TaxID=41117 RepID=UPI0018850829|nr:TGF-beta-activated kinase 1 and MAP3K7-binding protein 1-like [Pollicipes pollicipes]XP_037090763.1 TGF-beta-activated kinase 1 and MAP3K7-binding protein 1-like [Pollicipes pollicipes]XP_037093339.1 TGF-beta-activated kinase 1 and MAP3K7-binding protein 1-like [Pollicipes pollicipes]